MAIIAFDLDGTLIDSAPHIHHAFNAALRDCSLPPISQEAARSYVGRGVAHFIDCACADHGFDRRTIGAELESRMMHHYTHLSNDPETLYPGVLTALNTLLDAGHKLALCTNKPTAPTAAVLRDTPLGGLFDPVICGDSLPTRKPDPDMLLQTRAALYVGDSEVDAETAQRASVPFLLFTEGYRKSPIEALPHRTAFADFATLPGLVETALASSGQ